MKPHPATRSPRASARGFLGGIQRGARNAVYGTSATELLPRVALTPETRCPAIVLGCGEARTNLAERWSICDWDPVRFAVCLTDDDPVAQRLTAEGSAVVTLAPTDKSGPSWRGHAGAARPLGHLLMQLETPVQGAHETVHILRVQDAESFLLSSRQLWARQTRGSENDPAEALAWTIPRPIGLVTTANGSQETIFPADLCGALGHDIFVLSLGADSHSFAAVRENKTLTWSTIDASASRSVHDLRVNHVRPPRGTLSADVRHFRRSETLDLPLPMWALRTVELEVLATHIDHRAIIICRKLHSQRLRSAPLLAHLHRDALAWRNQHRWPIRTL